MSSKKYPTVESAQELLGKLVRLSTSERAMGIVEMVGTLEDVHTALGKPVYFEGQGRLHPVVAIRNHRGTLYTYYTHLAEWETFEEES